MTIHAPSDTTSFDACLRLFERYPLAVTRHRADGGYLSMVLLNRAAGQAGFFVLTQTRDDLFVIRSWNRHDGVDQGIRPGEPVGGPIHQLITGSMPIPRDGALLGWVTHRQVTVMLAVYARQQEPWDAPVPAPDIRVMPMAGHHRTAALAAVHRQPARRRAAVGVRRVGRDRGHRPARGAQRRTRVLGPGPGPAQRPARLRGDHGQPGGR